MDAYQPRPFFAVGALLFAVAALVGSFTIYRASTQTIGEIVIIYYVAVHVAFYGLLLLSAISAGLSFVRLEQPRVLRILSIIWAPFTFLFVWVMLHAIRS